MLFGLTNAPVVFHNLINDFLRDRLKWFVLVYLDDILVVSKNLQEHRQHVRLVLKRLLKNQLFAKAEKREFHVQTIPFLGCRITPGRITMDPAKVTADKEWLQPEFSKQLQHSLGFANFYLRFLRNYRRIAPPLNALTSTTRTFVPSRMEL